MIVLAHITSLLSIFPIIVALRYYQDLRIIDSKVFFFFLLGTCLIDLLGLGLSILSINNHFCYNIFLIWIGLYNVWLGYMLKSRILTSFSLYITLFCVWGITMQLDNFNKLLFIFTLLNLGTYSVLLLFRLTDISINPLKSSKFWAYSSLSFFAFSTFSMFVFIDYIVENRSVMILNFYTVYNFIVTLIVNILFSISFICLKKEKIS